MLPPLAAGNVGLQVPTSLLSVLRGLSLAVQLQGRCAESLFNFPRTRCGGCAVHVCRPWAGVPVASSPRRPLVLRDSRPVGVRAHLPGPTCVSPGLSDAEHPGRWDEHREQVRGDQPRVTSPGRRRRLAHALPAGVRSLRPLRAPGLAGRRGHAHVGWRGAGSLLGVAASRTD